MQMVAGVSVGAVVSTIAAPQLVGLLSRAWAGAANPRLMPLWKVLTGALLGAGLTAFRGTRKFGGYFLVGGAVSGLTDWLNQTVVPMIPTMAGYRGVGDYVQLGNQAMVEQGRFQGVADYVQLGTQAQVEAGQFGDGSGTFAPSF
jgi:hypothetical protein